MKRSGGVTQLFSVSEKRLISRSKGRKDARKKRIKVSQAVRLS